MLPSKGWAFPLHERIDFRPLTREDNEDMVGIIRRSPIEGRISVVFDRGKDAFAMPESRYLHYRYLGFVLDGKLVGLGMLGYENTYVNGLPEVTYHASSLYILPQARGKGLTKKSAPHFFGDAWRGSRIGYAIVMKGNEAARRAVFGKSKEIGYVPDLKRIGELEVKNILCMGRKRETSHLRITKAAWSDAEEMALLMDREFKGRLFGPVLGPGGLKERIRKRPLFKVSDYYIARSGGEIVGVAGLWDTSGIKRTIVTRYGWADLIGASFLRGLSSLHGTRGLPKSGRPIESVSLVDVAIKDDDPDVMRAILLRMYEDARKRYCMISFGSYRSDPVLKAASGFWTLTLRSDIILGTDRRSGLRSDPVDTSRPYIDIGAL